MKLLFIDCRKRMFSWLLYLCHTVNWVFQKLRQRELLYLPAQIAYFITSKILTSDRFLRKMANHEFSFDHCDIDSRRQKTAPQLDPTRWHWAVDDIENIASRVGDLRKAETIKKADDILRGKFEFRSTVRCEAETFTWDPSEMTKGWIWDLNRQNWFVTLAFAFRYTNDQRYIDEFICYSDNWITTFVAQGKLPENDNPFEVAARVNAWLWTYYLLHDQTIWEKTSKNRFISALRFLCQYLFYTIEYIAPGNHVLLEAKALALAGECFGQSEFGQKIRKRGWWYLKRELKKQVCADGIHAELSTMYHRIIAGELGELCLYYSKFRTSQFTWINEIVKKMCVFSAFIENNDGSFALFGDAHLEDTYYRFNPIRIFGLVPDYSVQFDDKYCDYTDWLNLANSNEHKVGGELVINKNTHSFTSGGYYIVRSGWHRGSDVLVWDCGQVGYKPNRKHAHADSLSFTLAVEGRPFLIDPGMDEAKSSRLALRSTRSHNAIVVDSQDSSILSARSEIWNPAVSTLCEVFCKGDVAILAGTHNGYQRLKRPVTVFRAIVIFTDRYWLVIDFVFGVGDHIVDQYFHLDSQVCASLAGDRASIVSHRLLSEYVIQFLCSNLQPRSKLRNLEVKTELEDRFASQYSGRIDKYKALRSTYSGVMPVVMTAGISKKGHNINVEQHLSGDNILVTVQNQSFCHRMTIKHSTFFSTCKSIGSVQFERIVD